LYLPFLEGFYSLRSSSDSMGLSTLPVVTNSILNSSLLLAPSQLVNYETGINLADLGEIIYVLLAYN